MFARHVVPYLPLPDRVRFGTVNKSAQGWIRGIRCDWLLDVGQRLPRLPPAVQIFFEPGWSAHVFAGSRLDRVRDAGLLPRASLELGQDGAPAMMHMLGSCMCEHDLGSNMAVRRTDAPDCCLLSACCLKRLSLLLVRKVVAPMLLKAIHDAPSCMGSRCALPSRHCDHGCGLVERVFRIPPTTRGEKAPRFCGGSDDVAVALQVAVRLAPAGSRQRHKLVHCPLCVVLRGPRLRVRRRFVLCDAVIVGAALAVLHVALCRGEGTGAAADRAQEDEQDANHAPAHALLGSAHDDF